MIAYRNVVLTILVLLFAYGKTKKSYEDHSLLSTFPKDENERNVLNKAVEELKCQVFKFHLSNGNSVDALCPDKEKTEILKDSLAKLGIKSEVTIDDYSRVVQSLSKQDKSHGYMSFDDYPRYEEIQEYLRRLARDHPEFVRLEIIGKTHEDRDIMMVKIGNSPQGDDTRAIWIDAGIHAREWIAPVTALYIAEKLVRKFDLKEEKLRREEKFKNVLTEVDWYIVPLANPDGYEYSNTHDRLWRKNRNPNIQKDGKLTFDRDNKQCFGVDLNRNFDVVGFGVGASPDPCSNTFQGFERNSEPEVKALTSKLDELKDNVRISLSLHSYGQMWLTSWGYKKRLPVDDKKMMRLGLLATRAIKSVNGRKYGVGSAGKIFYPAGGASDDFAKAKKKIPYAVTIELPEKNNYAFELPKSKIKGVGREIFATMGIVARTAKAEPLGPDVSFKMEMERNLKYGEE